MTLTDKEMKTLKPCPFCGNKTTNNFILKEEQNPNPMGVRFYYYIKCGDCGARGSDANKSKKIALKDWNKRAVKISSAGRK